MQRRHYYFLIIFLGFASLAFFNSHPVSGNAGYTGAPGDSICSSCHTGTNSALDGTVTIDGVPSQVTTGETYTLTVTVTNPNGNAVKAGFQLLALTGSNTNAGSMVALDPSTTEVKTVSGGKNYFGHSPAQNFPGSNTLSFDVDWTAPATVGAIPQIKFYASAVIANGNNQNSQDRVVSTNVFVPIVASAAPLMIDISNIVSTSCFDSSDGSATVNITGGVSPYNVVWSNGETGNPATQLPPGSFSVTVTDNANNTATVTADMPSPPEIILSCESTNTCPNSSNGSILLQTSGGTGTLNFIWSTGYQENFIEGLSPGTYTATVTDDNGCSATSECIVGAFSQITINSTPNNPSCANVENGFINIQPVDGGAPYTFLWSNGAAIQNISNLAEGDYSVTVTDVFGCTATESYTLESPLPIEVTDVVIVHASCPDASDGSISLTISGGSAPYNFQWSNGFGGTGFSVTNANLAPGNYTITVTDLFDCVWTGSYSIHGPDPIVFDTIIHQNITCYGMDNGAIIFVPDSLESVSYLWDDGSQDSLLNNLSIGLYHVTLTDNSNGCTYRDSFLITQPDSLQLSIVQTDSTCITNPNGHIALSVEGGSSPYAYYWNDSIGTSESFNLPPGEYFIRVIDSNQCRIDTTINIESFPNLSYEWSDINSPSCSISQDGSLGINVFSGVAPFTYAWSNGETSSVINGIGTGIYFVTVTDGHLCETVDSFNLTSIMTVNIALDTVIHNVCYSDSLGSISIIEDTNFSYEWSNGMVGTSIDHLGAGTYSVIGVDSSGCQTEQLTIDVFQNPKIVLQDLILDSLLCPGDSLGTLSFQIQGGVSPYLLVLNGDTTANTSFELLPGTYNLAITDTLGCHVEMSYQINVAPQITIDSVGKFDLSCYGNEDASIEISSSGGVGIHHYLWNTGSTSEKIDQLQGGTYIVSITDGLGCSLVDSFMVVEPDSLLVLEQIMNESIAGNNDGQVELTITGGTPPYDVFWTNGKSGASIDSLAPGFISYQVTDNNNCVKQGTVLINGGLCQLDATYTVVNASCVNTNDGQIRLDIIGNYDIYDISVYGAHGVIQASLDSLYSGTYSVFILDSVNCLKILTDVMVESETPAIVIDSVHLVSPSTTLVKDGQIFLDVSGGLPPYSFEWHKDDKVISTLDTLKNVGIGVYSVVISDQSECVYQNNSIFLPFTSSAKDWIGSEISIYPNPTDSRLHIASNTSLENAPFIIMNTLGATFAKGQLSGDYEIDLLPYNFKDGVYILRILKDSTELRYLFVFNRK